MDAGENPFSDSEAPDSDLELFIQLFLTRFPEKEEPPDPEAADLHPAPARHIESPEMKHYPGCSDGDQVEAARRIASPE